MKIPASIMCIAMFMAACSAANDQPTSQIRKSAQASVKSADSPTLPTIDTRDTTEDALLGEKLYASRCGACHSVEANRIGPMHRGVYERMAGSVVGYNYSNALIQSSVIWNEESLDLWLTNPQGFIPGQKMGYRLSKASERKAIITYLKSLEPQKTSD